MRTSVQKWGNSLGIRIPKVVAEEASLHSGSMVELIHQDGVLLVRPIHKGRPRYRLEDLTGKITPGNRHAEVAVGPRLYNERAGLALVCPITTKPKGYPFEVEVKASGLIGGCILADQIKSVDYRARRLKFVERAAPALTAEVLAKVAVLVT